MKNTGAKKYLCDVVPFAHIPLTREQFFWYSSKKSLQPGTLVRVPLFRRAVRGIVLACRDDFTASGTVRLKAITEVLHNNYLSHKQIALATHIAETTFTSLGTVMMQFYTPPVTERPQPLPPTRSTKPLPRLTKTTTSLCADILAQQNYASLLLRDTPTTARDALYLNFIKKHLARSTDAQILLLLPEILLTEQTAKRLRAHFAHGEIRVIHNKIAKGALWSAYQDIRNGTARIIIGTKKALFQPFANLTLIILDEEHDPSFKQWDRAPRFDTRTVADTLAHMYNCPLVAVSAAPRITKTVPTPLGPTPLTLPITLLDMRAVHFERIKEAQKKKRKKPTPTLFAPALLAAITDALKRKKQTLLFFNHKGMSAFSLCSDCGALLACPDCDRALVLTAEGHYECFHCTFTTSIFPKCAQCDGMTFRNIGYGTSKIHTMLEKRFPTARIARIDGHTMRTTHAATDIITQCANREVDIIIGTQMALKDWRSEHLAVVGILDADALLSIPDISADERLFAFISNAAAAVTHKRTTTGMVFVQTYRPDYHVLTHAQKGNYTAFRKDTLTDRKLLHYPPYWRMIKLIFQHRDAAKATALAQQWHDTITQHNTDTPHWRISAVHTPLLAKRRGLHRQQILIRLKNGTRSHAPIHTTLASLLSTLPSRTIIDIDPVNVV